jgi:hypothetical protein
VYAAACELIFRLPGIVKGNGPTPEFDSKLESIRSWLPVPSNLPGIVGNFDWREVAADIGWNYHAILHGTRA